MSGRDLRAARLGKTWSQMEAAARLGVSHALESLDGLDRGCDPLRRVNYQVRGAPSALTPIAHLAKALPLDANVLRARYRQELRPTIIGDPERHDRTLEMWIEAYFGS